MAVIQRTVFFEELQRRASQIPETHLHSPAMHIAGTALSAMWFTQDVPELRKLYVNLLGTSMNNVTARTAHPALVEVIRQLSPDEARMIQVLKPGDSWPEMDLLAVSPEDEDSFDAVALHVSTLGEKAVCSHVDLTPAYVENLCRLGIMAIPFGGYLSDESLYLD